MKQLTVGILVGMAAAVVGTLVGALVIAPGLFARATTAAGDGMRARMARQGVAESFRGREGGSGAMMPGGGQGGRSGRGGGSGPGMGTGPSGAPMGQAGAPGSAPGMGFAGGPGSRFAGASGNGPGAGGRTPESRPGEGNAGGGGQPAATAHSPGQPLKYSGNILPPQIMVVSAQTGGPIAHVYVHPGQRVAAGARLLDVESFEASRRLIEAEQAVRDARARVAEGKKEAAAVLALAQSPASTLGVPPRREGRTGRGGGPGGMGGPGVLPADPQARLKVAELDLARARKAVELTTVRAPVSGVVRALPAGTQGMPGGEGGPRGMALRLTSAAEPTLPRVGAQAGPNQPLCAIAGSGKPVLTFLVDEQDLSRIYGGQPAVIQPKAFADRKLTGRVCRIGDAAQIQPGGSKFPVIVEVLSALGRVRQGMSADITLVEKTPPQPQPQAGAPAGGLVGNGRSPRR